MNRLLGTVLGLLLFALATPYLARLAQQMIPALLSVVFFLAIARLFWPTRRRR